MVGRSVHEACQPTHVAGCARCTRWTHEWRSEAAGCLRKLLRTLADRFSLDCAALPLLLRTGCACFSTMVARNLRTALRRAWRGVACATAASFVVAEPPAGRSSGDAPAMS
ncbi:hypothetical protein F511_45616 [Dorcoceras hygrometricum]|uniref:Uncharacterized protein n=1 Tax=Dorcoceras hygrometricum TaxID=472368 RepID=A0A2Z7A314_9LAMI|nr:hypothetical protein F511_45616 [Dorcoceras hygrometricum]